MSEVTRILSAIEQGDPHAAVGRHQVWVWWAAGIVLGAAIIALFAVFEKRRADVLRLLEEIKRWE